MKTNKLTLAKIVYILLITIFSSFLILDLFPSYNHLSKWVSPALVLFSGICFSLIFGNVYPSVNKTLSKKLLQYSVVGLGFGLNVHSAIESGREGMTFTIISVVGTLLIGVIMGKYLFKINKNTSYLISSGTAICGGSAIATISPIIKAKNDEISVSLATVFILNAVALFIFPIIGHWFNMSQQQFGVWSAIAIHDTSSVVGAARQYGEEALNIATTIKLTRALWIVPMAFATSFIFKSKEEKVRVPMFIILFICAMLLNTYFLSEHCPIVSKTISNISKRAITLTMFFIGSSLSIQMIKSVGAKTLIQGVLLWIIITIATLIYVLI